MTTEARSDQSNPWEECYIHPKDIPVSRSRRHCYTAIVFGSAGLRQGRAVPKCRCRSDALRRRCRGRTVDQTRDGHAAASVQYAWPHGSKRYLYVATSSSAPGYGTAGTEHHVAALTIDPASGALTPHGAPIRLSTLPIRISTDIPSGYLLVAFNNPSAVRVYRINKDFTPGEEMKQPGPIVARIFAHQVRTTPDNRRRYW